MAHEPNGATNLATRSIFLLLSRFSLLATKSPHLVLLGKPRYIIHNKMNPLLQVLWTTYRAPGPGVGNLPSREVGKQEGQVPTSKGERRR